MNNPVGERRKIQPATEPIQSRRPRVVFVDHVARMSGGEIAMLRLLTALGHQIEAYVILGEDGPLVGALREAGAQVEVLAMQPELRDVHRGEVQTGGIGVSTVMSLASYLWRLRRRIRELKPDLMHTNSLKAAMYGGLAGRLARVPVVWHVRDRIADDYLPRTAVILVRAASRVLPTMVIANSTATLSTLPPQLSSLVLYNSARPLRPVLHDIAPGGVEHSPREPGPLRVGVVGRLAEWKGQHVFLRAFAQAFPGGQQTAWIIGSAMFGEDAYEQTLHDLARELGIADRVVWRGFREDVPAEMAQLDVLVHCSITPEPFGQVVVEGMSAGLPVVAAAAGGPVEIITNGVDGLLTPPGDVGALATVLRRLDGDAGLRATLAAAALTSVLRFSPEAATTQLIGIYSALLARTRRR